MLLYKRQLCLNSNCIGELEELANSKKSMIRRGVATNPNTPKYLIDLLIKDKNIEVVKAVAERKDLSIETFNDLAAHQNHDINVSLANNPNCPLNIQLSLYDISDKWGTFSHRFRLAKASKESIILWNLFNYTSSNGIFLGHTSQIITGLVINPNIPEELYNKIIKDGHLKNENHIQILLKRNCPKKVLLELLKNEKSEFTKDKILSLLGKQLSNFK